MTDETSTPARVRWARLRFAIIGPLLSAPAEAGELAARIAELAARTWRHPTTGETIRFSFKSLERWYYSARDEQDPIRALERKVPKHAGTHPSVAVAVAEAIRTLRKQHPRWSYQLVHDNLVALGREQPTLGHPAGLRHGVALHEASRAGQAPPPAAPRAGRRLRAARAPALRGGPRAWAVALRPPRTRRKVLTASGQWDQRHPCRRDRRDRSAPVLPPAGGTCGDGDTESFVHRLVPAPSRSAACLAACSVTTALPCSPPRLPGPRAPVGRAPHHAVHRPARAERQAGGLLRPDRGQADGDARRGATAHPRTAQPGHPGLGRAGNTSGTCTARPSKLPSIAGSPGPPSVAPAPSSDALRRAFRMEMSRSSAPVTAPSPSPASATRSPRPTVRSFVPLCASRAGICPAWTS